MESAQVKLMKALERFLLALFLRDGQKKQKKKNKNNKTGNSTPAA
jgi:hypothetical protein